MILDEKLYQIIGTRLAERRSELKMTQDALAESVGVLRTSITNIEAGRQKAPLGLLYRLCESLNIELSSILPSNKDVADNHMLSVEVDGETEELPIAINAVKPDVSADTYKTIEKLYKKIK